MTLKFDHPLSVSIGELPDLIVVEIVEPDLFISKESGKSISSSSTKIEKSAPKQFPSLKSFESVVVAANTVQVAANTAFLSQFGVTICLAVSLKAMWNLMNVMQVMAYLRLVVDWPANSHMILDSMHNAITLENILKEVKDSYFTDFTDDK